MHPTNNGHPVNDIDEEIVANRSPAQVVTFTRTELEALGPYMTQMEQARQAVVQAVKLLLVGRGMDVDSFELSANGRVAYVRGPSLDGHPNADVATHSIAPEAAG